MKMIYQDLVSVNAAYPRIKPCSANEERFEDLF